MRTPSIIKTFTDRHPYIGPLFWIVSIQYFLVQIIVGSTWTPPYSLSQNTISDLGNTLCGQYRGGFVCSQAHALMNVSFIVLGITMMLGAMLLYQEFRESRGSLVGFGLMGLAGFGTMLVGLFPENTISILHEVGAFLPFVLGNIGIITLGLVLDITKPFRYYSLLSGFMALIAVLLFASHTYLSLGIGGMERIAAYPQTIWLIAFGVYVLRHRLRSQATKT